MARERQKKYIHRSKCCWHSLKKNNEWALLRWDRANLIGASVNVWQGRERREALVPHRWFGALRSDGMRYKEVLGDLHKPSCCVVPARLPIHLPLLIFNIKKQKCKRENKNLINNAKQILTQYINLLDQPVWWAGGLNEGLGCLFAHQHG
jgi:hypothetical protein